MKFFMPLAIAGLLAVAGPVAAQSAFDGVWKVDLASAQLPDRPYVQTLVGGVYTCLSCVPNYTIPADGAFHPVAGFDYMDEASIKVVDDHTVEEAQKLEGKPMGTSTTTVSPDGATLTTAWIDASAPTGGPTSGESTMTRIAAAAAGSHAVSGSWKQVSVANVSDNSLIATISLTDDVFSFAQASGYSYAARIGGPAVPIVGDQADTMVTVKMLPNGFVEETDTIDGAVVSVVTYAPAADGGTMLITFENKKVGTTTRYTVVKQ